MDFFNASGVAFASLLVILTLLLRNFILMLGVVAFPVAVLLYFLPPTKGHGLSLLNLLFLMAFMQVADVIVLIVSSYFWQTIPILEAYRLLFTLIFVFVVNLAFFFTAFGSVIGFALGAGLSALSGGGMLLGAARFVKNRVIFSK